jgi:hypothetical protein
MAFRVTRRLSPTRPNAERLFEGAPVSPAWIEMSLENDALDLADDLLDKYGLERAKQILDLALKEINDRLASRPSNIPT